MTLNGVAQHGVVGIIDQRTDLGGNLAYGLADVVLVVVLSGRVLVELEDLLLKGHPSEQRIDPLLDDHILPGGHGKGAPYGVMGRQLRPAPLQRIDAAGRIGIPHDRPSRQRLEPRAGRRIAAVGQFEMIAVAVERIAQRRGASVLDGRTRGDHAADLRRVVQRTAHALQNAGIHLRLIPVVEHEFAMLRIAGIGPRLVEPDLQRGIVDLPLDTGDQIAQIGLVGHVATRPAAGLLQGDDIPRLVGQRPGERHVRLLGAHAVDHLAVGIGRCVTAGIVPVAFERTAADVQVSDHGLDAGRVEQLPEILFDGILREAVADGQDAQRPGRLLRLIRSGGYDRCDRSRCGVRSPGRDGGSRQKEQERRKHPAEEVFFHRVFISTVCSFVIRPEPDRAPRYAPRPPWSRHPRPEP